MKDIIKIGLLGVIALLAAYKTYTMVAPENGFSLTKSSNSDNTVVTTDVNNNKENNDHVTNNNETEKIVKHNFPIILID